MRYLIGVHKYAPKAAFQCDMGWISLTYRIYLCIFIFLISLVHMDEQCLVKRIFTFYLNSTFDKWCTDVQNIFDILYASPFLERERNTCKVRRRIEMLRLWNRLVGMSDDRFVKRVFNWDYNICLNNSSCEVNMSLQNLQILECLHSVIVCTLGNVRIRLMELECDSWKDKVINTHKLCAYLTFKHLYEREQYAEMNLSRSERSYLVQCRWGSLPTRIETRRFR